MYRANIVVRGKDGTILLEKSLKGEQLEILLKVDGADLYAEAQQEEIKKGLDLITDEEYEQETTNFN